jgi:hypothetical protein
MPNRTRDATICALAQHVEVVDGREVRITGSKTELLPTLVAAASVKSAAVGVHSFIPKWRASTNMMSPPKSRRFPYSARPVTSADRPRDSGDFPMNG